MNAKKHEKIIGATGTISGTASILGSWQICHSVCIGIISLLSIMGIAVVGMPLLFLTKFAVWFWIAAVILLAIIFYFYITKKCISSRQILFNSGLIIAGVPFSPVQPFILYFWIVGGIIAIIGASLYVKDKLRRKHHE